MPAVPNVPESNIALGSRVYTLHALRIQKMKQRFVPIFSLLAGLAGTALAAEAPSFELKDGDRVVFYGDSITDQRLYTTFAETFAVTRFPQMNVTFVHSG